MFQIYIGVDGWFWQWFYGIVSLMVELYEDDVLNFNVMVVIFFWVFWRVVLDVIVVVKEDFGVWVVWIGVVYLLEVVRSKWCVFVVVDVDNMFVWNVYFIGLDVESFVIGFVNGNLQFFFWQCELVFIGQQFLCVFDGILFEVIVKVEVVQYFKKGVVMCGVIDVFQIVVFIICMYVMLCGGCM